MRVNGAVHGNHRKLLNLVLLCKNEFALNICLFRLFANKRNEKDFQIFGMRFENFFWKILNLDIPAGIPFVSFISWKNEKN